MSPLAAWRTLSCLSGGPGGEWKCPNTNNRGGQDKSRNVRPVGWRRNSSENTNLRHIASLSRTLRICPTLRIYSNFYTLRVRP